MEVNPYAPPRELETTDVATPSAARIRRAHLATEAGIRVMAVCYLLFAPFVVIGPLHIFGELALWQTIGFCLVAALQIVAALGLWRWKPWSRPFVAVVSGLGLLAFPLGTLVNIHFLRLVFGGKGRMVFSPRYREIVKTIPTPAGGISRGYEAFLVVLGLLFVGFILGLPFAD